jgi:hypothetical protein
MRWHFQQFLPRRLFGWLIRKVSSPASAFVSDIPIEIENKVNKDATYNEFITAQPTNPDIGVYVLLE